MGVAYLCLFLGQAAVAVVRAYGRMEVEAGLIALYSLTFLLWVLLAPHTPLALAWGWVATYAIYTTAGLTVIYWRFLRPAWGVDTSLIREIGHIALPLGLAALLMLVYTRLPIYALTALSTPQQVGLFNAAFGLVRNLQVIAFTLNGALAPVFVQLAASD